MLGSALALVLAAPAAAQNPIVNPDAVVDPGAETASDSSATDNTETDTETNTETTETIPDGTSTDGTETDGSETGTELAPQPPPRSAAWGNAAMRPAGAKVKEAAGDCGNNRPPISKMLGIGGSVQRDEGAGSAGSR